jgi:hypothetical protein
MDATRIIEQLDPDAIRQRLANLAGEEAALRSLLRAALARQRARAARGEPDAAQERHGVGGAGQQR